MLIGIRKVMAPDGAPAGGGGDPAPILSNPPPPAPPPGNANPPPPSNSYGADDWRSKLPDDIREEASLKNMNSPEVLAKSYLHAQRQLGFEKVPKPGQHATEEDWQKFWDAVGRPALDKYEVKLPKDAKHVAPEILNELKPLAHKVGILPKQLEAILDFQEKKSAAAANAASEATKTKIQTGIKSLQDEWGKTFDQRTKWAAKYIEEVGGPEVQKFFKENPEIGNNPLLIKLFGKLAEAKYKEGAIVGDGAGGTGLMSPSEAQAKINEIMGMSDHPYHKPEHPGHAGAVDEVKGLYKMIYPEEKGA